jgi:hypothetical protein
MQPQRETMTDRLADIIHIIHLGGKSGILTVERGEGRTREEGVIVFVDGRVVEAKVGGTRSGAVAFNYLNTWLTCRFSFASHTANSSQMPRLSAPLPASSQQENVPQQPFTGTSSLNVRALLRQRTGQPQHNERQSNVAFPSRLEAGETALLHPEVTPLSRVHRRLLLLVNGQRSVSELARLASRRPEDVQQMLNDLERAKLIQQ